jgi:hypothetical protein
MTPAEWLGAVWNMWQQNQPVATVMLRSNWGLIDAPLLEAYSDPAFLRTARCVTAHRGDPPVTPEQRAVARALIHGQAPAGADGVLKPLADRSTPFAAVALALSRADLLRFQKAAAARPGSRHARGPHRHRLRLLHRRPRAD